MAPEVFHDAADVGLDVRKKHPLQIVGSVAHSQCIQACFQSIIIIKAVAAGIHNAATRVFAKIEQITMIPA